MAITSVNSSSKFNFFTSGLSDEAKQIISKLLAHGVTPSGNKSVDRAKLHEIELKEAQANNYVTGDFLTVTREEEEKILENKLESRGQTYISEDFSNVPRFLLVASKAPFNTSKSMADHFNFVSIWMS